MHTVHAVVQTKLLKSRIVKEPTGMRGCRASRTGSTALVWGIFFFEASDEASSEFFLGESRPATLEELLPVTNTRFKLATVVSFPPSNTFCQLFFEGRALGRSSLKSQGQGSCIQFTTALTLALARSMR